MKRQATKKRRFNDTIQVSIKVTGPKSFTDKIDARFLRDAISSIAAGEEVPGIEVSVIHWIKDGDIDSPRSKHYKDESDIIDVLNRLQRIGANVTFNL